MAGNLSRISAARFAISIQCSVHCPYSADILPLTIDAFPLDLMATYNTAKICAKNPTSACASDNPIIVCAQQDASGEPVLSWKSNGSGYEYLRNHRRPSA